jgi:hypothetical protein
MRRFVCSSVLALLAAVVGLGMLPDKAEATTACYKWSLFPDQRWVLSIKSHSLLVNGQKPYSVHGKYVGGCGTGTVATISGSIITNASTANPPKGARLGLRTTSVRGTGATETCFPVAIDCSSPETNTRPSTWSCQSRSDEPVYHGVSTLIEVPVTDPLCNAFE